MLSLAGVTQHWINKKISGHYFSSGANGHGCIVHFISAPFKLPKNGIPLTETNIEFPPINRFGRLSAVSSFCWRFSCAT